MQWLLERILGLPKEFLSRQGEFSLGFNPRWPLQEYLGAVTWNVLLAALALAVIVYVYRREGRGRAARITLACVRALLVAFVIVLLNRPVLTLGQTREEPSVVALLVDDSISMMRMHDVDQQNPDRSPTRLAAAVNLLTEKDQALLRRLGAVHQLRFYRFSADARPLGSLLTGGRKNDKGEALKPEQVTIDPKLVQAIKSLDQTTDQPAPDRNRTQVVGSLLTVLNDLQGQRLAGVVVITDGRDTPVPPATEAMKRLKDFNVPVYPVALGSEKSPTNLEVQAVSVQDAVFVDDIANLKMTVRATGYPPGHPVRIVLKDKATGQPLKDADGNPAQKTLSLDNDAPSEQELQFKPDKVGPLTVVAEIEKQPGELEATDNAREAPVSVLDAHIAVLYVDGYPRWEYRYIKNEMIRDKTVDISCYLTSADPTFAQEGDPADSSRNFPGPIKRFPETMEELMSYDVVLFGDVNPTEFFTDRQLQLVAEFVSKKGGGFGMVAGPRYSPWEYKNTAIEAVLPVDLGDVDKFKSRRDEAAGEGFRPVLTRVGAESSIFRFFSDREQNRKYIQDELQPLFWYAQGVSAKPGVGEVYAEHPKDQDPGRKMMAPLLVLGRYGAGRTLFSAIDDSWRWRFYTGEQTFDTYWIQQLRYLARGRKLGERRLNFATNRRTYDLGEQVRITLEILDPVLLQQLPQEIAVELKDREGGQTVRYEKLQRVEGQPDEYAATFTADRIGQFTLKLPAVVSEAASTDVPIDVSVPKLEMARPEANLPILRQIAAPDPQTKQPAVLTLAAAPEALPRLLPSAAKTLWIPTSEPLWDAPLALLIFILLLTTEWVIRKLYGML